MLATSNAPFYFLLLAQSHLLTIQKSRSMPCSKPDSRIRGIYLSFAETIVVFSPALAAARLLSRTTPSVGSQPRHFVGKQRSISWPKCPQLFEDCAYFHMSFYVCHLSLPEPHGTRNGK